MASNWPTSIDNFGYVSGSVVTGAPNTAGLTHSELHNLLSDALTQLETTLQGYTPDVDSGGGGGNPSYFPANSTGITTVVQHPDEVSGSNSATILVTPQDQMILGVKLAGDASPRWMLTSDATDGLYLGDG